MADEGASTVVAIADKGGVPLAPSQRDMTPLQRMVILKELERQHEEAEEARNGRGGMGASRGSPKLNSKAPGVGGSTMQGDTVTYVNKGAE